MGARSGIVMASLIATSFGLAGCKSCDCGNKTNTGNYNTNTPTGTSVHQTSARPAMLPGDGTRQPPGIGPYPQGNMISTPGTINPGPAAAAACPAPNGPLTGQTSMAAPATPTTGTPVARSGSMPPASPMAPSPAMAPALPTQPPVMVNQAGMNTASSGSPLSRSAAEPALGQSGADLRPTVAGTPPTGGPSMTPPALPQPVSDGNSLPPIEPPTAAMPTHDAHYVSGDAPAMPPMAGDSAKSVPGEMSVPPGAHDLPPVVPPAPER